MSDQQRQLDIMATGGFDVQHDDLDFNFIHGLNPETLLIMKERVEADMSNPCIGCVHEHDYDPYVLDYCHTSCKEPDVEPIDLVDEVA